MISLIVEALYQYINNMHFDSDAQTSGRTIAQLIPTPGNRARCLRVRRICCVDGPLRGLIRRDAVSADFNNTISEFAYLEITNLFCYI